MTGPPSLMTGTPGIARSRRPALPEGSAELLSGVFETIQVASALFFRGEFSAPWALVTPGRDEIMSVLAPAAERLTLFHIVLEGECEVRVDLGDACRARAGDAIVMPYCDRHTLAGPAPASPIPVAALLPPRPWPSTPPLIRLGGGGASTRLLCGYLHCEDLLFDPFVRALPPLIHVRPPPGPAAAWFEASVAYVAAEAAELQPAAATLRRRLPELLFIDCLRRFAEELPETEQGWLAALRDPAVGRALTRIHAEPTREWTVGELARACAVSRSVLAQRFSDLLGISPMRYVTRWRLQLATQRLRATEDGLAAIAAAVGYESEAAFGRAFKREVGISPGEWRARHQK